MKHSIGFIILALLMSSCSIYTRYERQAVDTSGLYRGISADTTVSLAHLHWDELFADTLLQALIREGLQTNTDLRIARLKTKEALAALHSANLAYLPSMQLDPQASLSAFDGASPTKSYMLGASASWEIDFFGKLTTAKRKARAALEQSDCYSQAVQTELISTIAGNYYTLLMLDEQEAITAETLASWDEYIRTLRALMRAGEYDRPAVSQAEANRLAVKNSLADLRLQIKELENSLSVMPNRMPGHIRRGTLQE